MANKLFTIDEIVNLLNTLIGVSHTYSRYYGSRENPFLEVCQKFQLLVDFYATNDIPLQPTYIGRRIEMKREIFGEVWNWIESHTDWDLDKNRRNPFTTQTNLTEVQTFRPLLNFFGLQPYENPLGGYVGTYNARVPVQDLPTWLDPRVVHRYKVLQGGSPMDYPKWSIVKTREKTSSQKQMLRRDDSFQLSRRCDELLGILGPDSEYEEYIDISHIKKVGNWKRPPTQFVPMSSLGKYKCVSSGITVGSDRYIEGDRIIAIYGWGIGQIGGSGWVNNTRLMRKERSPSAPPEIPTYPEDRMLKIHQDAQQQFYLGYPVRTELKVEGQPFSVKKSALSRKAWNGERKMVGYRLTVYVTDGETAITVSTPETVINYIVENGVYSVEEFVM